MDTIKGYFGAKPEVPEKPIALERTPSGTRKSVKELSPLANNVIGRCARCKVFSMFLVTRSMMYCDFLIVNDDLKDDVVFSRWETKSMDYLWVDLLI